MSQTIDPMGKVETITAAWQSLAPEASFAGMTLEQFSQAMAPVLDVRKELSDLSARWISAMSRRTDVYKSASAILDRVVASVRADIAYGPDSHLWSAMGFVRKSARKRRVSRKSGIEAAPAAPSPQVAEEAGEVQA